MYILGLPVCFVLVFLLGSNPNTRKYKILKHQSHLFVLIIWVFYEKWGVVICLIVICALLHTIAYKPIKNFGALLLVLSILIIMERVFKWLIHNA